MNDCLQHTRVRSILSLVIPNPFCCQQHHWFPEGLQYLSLVLLNFCHIFATRADTVASRTKRGRVQYHCLRFFLNDLSNRSLWFRKLHRYKESTCGQVISILRGLVAILS